MKITIYGREGCEFCKQAIALGEIYGEVTYLELDKDYTREVFKELFPEAKTFPQIMINDEKIGGYGHLLQLDKEVLNP